MLLWYWGRRGGGAQYALCLARALSPDVALSLSQQNELIEPFRLEAVPRHEVNTYTNIPGFLAGFARLPKLGRDLRRFALAHSDGTVISAMSHPWTPFIAPGLVRAGLSFVPIIHEATPHPGDPAPLFSWRLTRELSVASAAVTLSESVAMVLERRWPKLPLMRLNLPAHLPFGIADVPKTSEFLFFGRFRAYKGLDILRDAWPMVRAAWPEATLRIVGSGQPESVAPGISALPGVLLEARWVPDSEIGSIIASSHCLVLPYRHASQSGVLPLALAHGIPVIATTVGALTAQIADGKSGILVQPDAAALAAAMLRLREPSCYARLAQGAQAAGELLSDWSAHADALREGIAKVIGR